MNENVSKCIRMFLDGYQYNEIADILNMPIDSVGVYISRAKKVLHKTMKNEYELYKA
jgi:DNA-directed RNA polymerase specialized sigma24 family protein